MLFYSGFYSVCEWECLRFGSDEQFLPPLWMQIAEVLYPTADCVTVELNRIQCLEAREVIVRTLSTQGESQDSSVAFIPHNLIGSPQLSHRTTAPPHPASQASSHPAHTQSHPPYPSTYPPNHPQPQMQAASRAQHHTLPHTQPVHHPPPPAPHASSQPHFLRHSMPKSKPLLSARESETKEHDAGLRSAQPWERSPSPLPPMCGHNLEPPHFQPRRSPSPQRILPQPQGVPIPNTIAKAMAREAAQRVFAEGNRVSGCTCCQNRPNADTVQSYAIFNFFFFARLRKGISSVSAATHCSLSTLTRRRTAMTLHTPGGEEPL